MATETETGHTVWVCIDCYYAHHGLADELDPDALDTDGRTLNDLLSRLADARDVTAGVLHDNTDDPDQSRALYEEDYDLYRERFEEQSFSRSRCEGCGSTLGGTRHALTAWY